VEVTFHKLEKRASRKRDPSFEARWRISACPSDTFLNRRVEKMHSSMDVGCRRKRQRQRQQKEGDATKGQYSMYSLVQLELPSWSVAKLGPKKCSDGKAARKQTAVVWLRMRRGTLQVEGRKKKKERKSSFATS